MKSNVLNIATSILQKSDRDHPADAMLREELRRHRQLTAGERTEIAHTVFAHSRWLGWVERTWSMTEQIDQAMELRSRYSTERQSISDEELLQRAVPEWIKREIDVQIPWVRSLQVEPRLWLRARVGQGRALALALGECVIPTNPALADAVEYRGREDLFHAREFQAGDFELQDISSQWVGLVCAPQPGETWWDVCAGEGGKLLHLSDLMRNKGLIWASDRAEWRLKRLKQRTARARAFNYRSVPWDGGAKLPTKTKFDGVLVDAPCSGVGTWQRNPHARWTTMLADVQELAVVQRDLLTRAASALKPGGRLIYSVCTLTRSETTGVVEEFEKACPDFQPLPLANPFRPDQPAQPRLWLWPQDGGGNGMFVAAWQRPA